MAGLAVTARDFGLEGPRGWAFRGISFAAEPGSLIAVEGPSGSGRTSLLLALTGRMKATEGTAVVGDARLPKQMAALRRVSALAHVPGVTDLDPALTVGEHLRERALLERRFGVSLRGLLRPRAERAREARLRIDAALTAAGLDRQALPKGSRTSVRDLERVEALRLSIALALVGRPRLLGVDDTDLKLSDAERAEVWALLRSLTEGGTTVVAVCSEAPGDAVVVSTERGGGDVPEAPEPGGDGAADDVPEDPEGADSDVPDERDGRDGQAARDDAKEAADAFAEAGRA
ncbi:ABC transporter ATP-binding protein [Streptomyces spinoverrucosus]|uniref:ABC transporter ATP-binding protein n=1 Tax=Streptomyces spinoverrucosus TaxID=284043 RepID=UPI0011419CD7|nr:ATP-binding cassette domain-containing protein [Streptomyces spinoverrucosus]